MHLRKLFGVFFLGLVGLGAEARTIYVSPNGSAEIGSSSAGNPSSIAKIAADNKLADNDEIIFLAGTYDLTDSTYGATIVPVRKANLVFRGATGDPKDVVIDGKGLRRAFYHHAGWGSSGDNVTIRDLTLKNCNVTSSSAAFNSSGSAVNAVNGGMVSNCVFINCQHYSSTAAVVDFGATKTGIPGLIADCTFVNDAPASNFVYRAILTTPSAADVIIRGCMVGGYRSNAIYGSKSANYTTKLYDCTVTNCYGYWGGAVRGDVSVISNCTFRDNVAVGSGAAVYETSRTMEVRHSKFIRNVLTGKSGAQNVASYGGAITMFVSGTGDSEDTSAGYDGVLADCTFEGNVSSNGVAGAVRYPLRRVERCTFGGNVAKTYGGAVQAASGTGCTRVDFVDCHFNCNTNTYSDNRANGGGAIYVETARAVLSDCSFTNNWSGCMGGAILCAYTDGNSSGTEANSTSRDLAMTNCVFSGNGCVYHGGAFRGACTGGVVRCAFVGNWSKGVHNDGNYTSRGGAIELLSKPGTTNRFAFCVFEDNVCGGLGGGAISHYCGASFIERCTFRRNRQQRCTGCTFGPNGGGAIAFTRGNTSGNRYLYKQGTTVDSCVFEGNVACEGQGGALNLGGAYTDHAVVRNSLFLTNKVTAANKYGGAVSTGSNSWVTACTFVRNSSASNGGALDNGGANNWKYFGTVRNCLFWKNTASSDDARNVYAFDKTIAAIAYCAEDGTSGKIPTGAAAHNLYLGDTAGFVDEAKCDYRLTKGSPLVDKGLNESWMSTPGTKDLSGQKRADRVYNEIVDIGCYEYVPAPGLMLLLK